MVTVQDLREKELAYCRSNIDYFVDTYGHIEDKDAVDLIQPFSMWKEQRDALHSLMKHKWNVILKARQLGFSWLVLHIAAHYLISPGKTVIGLSRTEEEAKELVRRLSVIFTYMPELFGDKKLLPVNWQGAIWENTALTLKVTFPNGQESVFKGFPSAPGVGRSFTANLIIFDEWAFQNFAEEIWQAGFPTINRPSGGKVIGLSTIERGSLFEQIFTDPDNGFNKIFIPWYADPRRDQNWYEQTRKTLGDLITAEYPATIEEALMVPGGAYFPEVKRDTHEVYDEPKGKVKRYVSIDYGLDMLSLHWISVDIMGYAQVYREYDAKDMTVSQAAEVINRIGSDEYIDAYLAPPDLWNRRQETGKSVADIFAEKGIILTKTSNDLFNGCMAMKEWLRVPEDGSKPALTFLKDRCPTLIRSLQKIQKDKNKPKVYAKDPHDLTHACLTGDMLVQTTEGLVRIDKIATGGEYTVFCLDKKGRKRRGKVVDAQMTRPLADVYEIELEDGTIIKSTLDHKFMTEDGFKPVSELNPGDCIAQSCFDLSPLHDTQGYNFWSYSISWLKRACHKLNKFFLRDVS